ncbi:MAG: hypothetical protein ACYSTZ_01495 [Planctomycetota bacterium]|jgi:hypothetical protein
MDKVLVYCPLTPTAPGVHQRTLESIFALEWDGQADIVFGKHDRYLPQRRDISNYENERNYDIANKYNQARGMALDGGYDALMTIEADMMPPANALNRLAHTGADISYGLYVSRHGKHPWLTMEKVTEQVRGSKGMGETWQERGAMWGKVIASAGVGLGCTFIGRDVLEAITFRVKDEFIANDWYFAIDAREKGFTQAHDCSVVCGHIDGYRTLWPDVTNGWRATDEEKINYQELLNMADGKYIVLTTLDMGDHYAKPGEKVELSDEVAKVLLKKRAIKPAKKAEVKTVRSKDYGTNN